MRGRVWLRWPSALGALLLAGCGAATTPAERSAEGAGRLPAGAVVSAVVRPLAGEALGAAIQRPVRLRAKPSTSARVVARVATKTEFGSPMVLAVLRQRGRWLGVAAAQLGNGRLGWVRQDDVKLLREQWSIVVDLSDRRAALRFKGRLHRSFPVAVGAAGTPTPTGRYGVTDRLSTGGPGSPYGCCVLALTGRQPNVPQDWPGGDRIAIHGTSAPLSIGQAASTGCLRAGEGAMRMLIDKVPLGTPVVIRR